MVKQKPRQSRKQPDICFDQDALKTHLKGFSARKTARRVFGLAKQKQKERLARNQRRAELHEKNNVGDEPEPVVTIQEKNEESVVDNTIVYKDVSTQKQWGGDVIVTTTTQIPDEETEMDLIREKEAKDVSQDKNQAYAGSIEKFIHQVRSRLPAKPKRKANTKRGITPTRKSDRKKSI